MRGNCNCLNLTCKRLTSGIYMHTNSELHPQSKMYCFIYISNVVYLMIPLSICPSSCLHVMNLTKALALLCYQYWTMVSLVQRYIHTYYVYSQSNILSKVSKLHEVRVRLDIPRCLFIDTVIICPPFSWTILSAASGFSPTETHRLFSHPGAKLNKWSEINSPQKYTFQVYLPCALIVVLSWVGFWLNRNGQDLSSIRLKV